MSARSAETARNMVLQALEGHLDQPLVSAQWFRHAGGFEDGPSGLKRVLGRLFRRADDHPANRLAYINVLVLTDSHLVAFTARAGMSGLKVKERIGEWSVDAAAVRFKQRTATSSKFSNSPGGGPGSFVTSQSSIVRATLRAHGDPRELRMDFPDDPLTNELIDAIKATRRPASDAARTRSSS